MIAISKLVYETLKDKIFVVGNGTSDNNRKDAFVITNDGNKPKSVIFENEGIKGMHKKLPNINGSLKVITDDNFKLIIKA